MKLTKSQRAAVKARIEELQWMLTVNYSHGAVAETVDIRGRINELERLLRPEEAQP